MEPSSGQKRLLSGGIPDRFTRFSTGSSFELWAAPDEAARLGAIYAQWVRSHGFNFESCDGIANRVEIFVDHGSIAVKAECMLALLMMGTSHNRWYVERKFVDLCGPGMDEVCAKRLAIEIRADSDNVCAAISHLEHSIRTSRSVLHPLLVKTLSEICK